MKHNWKHNIWTGNYLLDIDKNCRIIRLGEKRGAIYRAEYWGDYSLQYPISTCWRKTLRTAKKDAKELKKRQKAD